MSDCCWNGWSVESSLPPLPVPPTPPPPPPPPHPQHTHTFFNSKWYGRSVCRQSIWDWSQLSPQRSGVCSRFFMFTLIVKWNSFSWHKLFFSISTAGCCRDRWWYFFGRHMAQFFFSLSLFFFFSPLLLVVTDEVTSFAGIILLTPDACKCVYISRKCFICWCSFFNHFSNKISEVSKAVCMYIYSSPPQFFVCLFQWK